MTKQTARQENMFKSLRIQANKIAINPISQPSSIHLTLLFKIQMHEEEFSVLRSIKEMKNPHLILIVELDIPMNWQNISKCLRQQFNQQNISKIFEG